MTAGTQEAVDDANYMTQSQGVLKEDLLLDTGDGWQSTSAIEKEPRFIEYTRHNDTRLNTF